MSFMLTPIGEITAGECFGIKVFPEYISALEGLEGFSHIEVIWWFSECDNEKSRNKLTEKRPYKYAPESLGTFATHSPERPNPLALTVGEVTYIDMKEGFIGLSWIDAFDKTPVLDIKPYTPSFSKVEESRSPQWCSHWPQSVEKSGEFNWGEEFNF